MRKSNVFANFFKKPHIYSILFLFLGVVFIIVGIYFNKIFKKDFPKWIDYGMVILIFGDGFDKFCNPEIDITFNDKGNIELGLNLPDSKTEPQNMWLFAITTDISFTWTVSGNVENRIVEIDNNGKLHSVQNKEIHGNKGWITPFYVKLDNDGKKEKITFQVSEENVSYQCRDRIKIMTPRIGTIYPSEERYQLVMEVLNGMELEQIPISYLNEMSDSFFSAGEIDGTSLSPAAFDINCIYSSEKYFPNSRYMLEHVDPNADTEYRNILNWNSKSFLFWPTIEYKDKKSANIYGIIKFLLLSVGAYLSSLSVEKIFSFFFQLRDG